MDEQKLKGTLGAVSLFLIVATIYVAAAAFNKFKESGQIGQTPGARATISVSGEADVFAKPDLAVVMISTVNEAKTVESAMTVNTANMNSIIKFVKEQGVEEKDLKTTNFSISPRYEYEQSSSFYYPSGKRVLAGYEARQSLEVKIRDMSKIGILIEGASGDGANEIGDLQFTIENQDELKAQARKEAISKAKAKAKELSSQMGVKLGRIVGFSESGFTPQPYYEMAKSSTASGMGGATPDIAIGENKITSLIIITYEIR